MKSRINGFLIDSKNHEPRYWGGYKPAEKSTRAKSRKGWTIVLRSKLDVGTMS